MVESIFSHLRASLTFPQLYCSIGIVFPRGGGGGKESVIYAYTVYNSQMQYFVFNVSEHVLESSRCEPAQAQIFDNSGPMPLSYLYWLLLAAYFL
jgi:hypothetical protein